MCAGRHESVTGASRPVYQRYDGRARFYSNRGDLLRTGKADTVGGLCDPFRAVQIAGGKLKRIRRKCGGAVRLFPIYSDDCRTGSGILCEP